MSEKFHVWNAVKLGTSDKDDLISALAEVGMRASPECAKILKKPDFPVSKDEQQVDLVLVSVEDLLPGVRATWSDICDGAKKLGLELCPPELGVQLRIQYPDQPFDEIILVGMESITDTSGKQCIFFLEKGLYGRLIDTVECPKSLGFWPGHLKIAFIWPH